MAVTDPKVAQQQQQQKPNVTKLSPFAELWRLRYRKSVVIETVLQARDYATAVLIAERYVSVLRGKVIAVEPFVTLTEEWYLSQLASDEAGKAPKPPVPDPSKPNPNTPQE